MSFSIYLLAFKNNELDFRVREEVALELAANKSTISYENGQFYYCHTDQGRAEFSLATNVMISGIDVTIRNLSPGLVEYLFELLQHWRLLLVDAQGTNEVEHPTIFALTQDYFHHLPLDLTSHRCVIESADILHKYLAESFTAWSKYRDQIVNKRSVINAIECNPIHANSNHADIRSLFDLIAAPLDLKLRNSLWQQVKKKMDKSGVEDALHDVFSSLDNKKQWVWLQVDVRDIHEVHWQAVAIAKTLALPDQYIDVEGEQEDLLNDTTTLSSLWHFDSWLSQFQKSFILIEDGDTYFGFVISDSDVETAIKKLKNIGIIGQAIRQITFNSTMADESESYPILDDTSIKHEVMVFNIAPSNKALSTLVTEHRRSAMVAGRIPLICVSASWCEPCQEMFIALHQEDAQSVMKQLVVILLDIDDWGIHLEELNIYPTCVPIFFDVLEDGSAGQKSVDGDAWDDSIPSVLADILRDTFKLK